VIILAASLSMNMQYSGNTIDIATSMDENYQVQLSSTPANIPSETAQPDNTAYDAASETSAPENISAGGAAAQSSATPTPAGNITAAQQNIRSAVQSITDSATDGGKVSNSVAGLYTDIPPPASISDGDLASGAKTAPVPSGESQSSSTPATHAPPTSTDGNGGMIIIIPSGRPTLQPTSTPMPTKKPTVLPTPVTQEIDAPLLSEPPAATQRPTAAPTKQPTAAPTATPTITASSAPESTPSIQPAAELLPGSQESAESTPVVKPTDPPATNSAPPTAAPTEIPPPAGGSGGGSSTVPAVESKSDIVTIVVHNLKEAEKIKAIVGKYGEWIDYDSGKAIKMTKEKYAALLLELEPISGWYLRKTAVYSDSKFVYVKFTISFR